jgi:hypothetical protein
MEFETVLRGLLTGLERDRIRYGVIGGFALGVLGVPRATLDLDLLVHRDDLASFHDLMVGLGYTRAVATENVSHYRHADEVWGAVDVLHAFRAPSVAMLARAHPVPVFGGAMTMAVLEPEDVIGLKVQAMANDPRRRAQDVADIEALMARYRTRLDWARIREYFELFGLSEDVAMLAERFGHAE